MTMNKIKCLPTYTTGFLVMSMELEQKSMVKIDLYNITGQFITTLESQMYPAGKNNVLADISQYPAGLYHIKFVSGTETVSCKISKH